MEKRSNFSPFQQYFRYISNVKSPITYKFVKCGCSNYSFLNSENLICRVTDISKCFRGPLGTRDNESRLYMYTSYISRREKMTLERFHDQFPQKLFNRAGVRTCKPWIGSQPRYRLRYGTRIIIAVLLNISFLFIHLFLLNFICILVSKPQICYLLTCAPNEGSNQPAHLHSLIRVFIVRMEKLCTLVYPKCAQRRFWPDCANRAGWSEYSLGVPVERYAISDNCGLFLSTHSKTRKKF